MQFYDDFYRYARKTRLYVNEWTRKEIGRDTWKELLKEFVGQLTIDRARGSSLNSIWEELVGIFPYLFSIETANEADQLLEFFRVYREARNGSRTGTKDKTLQGTGKARKYITNSNQKTGTRAAEYITTAAEERKV